MNSNGGIMKQVLFIIAIMLGLPLVVRAADGTWNLNNAGNWFGTPANWSGSVVPGVLGTNTTTNPDKATFGSVNTAARAITLGDGSTSGVNIKSIEFAGNSYAYSFSSPNLLLTDGGTLSTTGGGANTFVDTINSFVIFQNGGSGFGSYTFDASSANAGHTLLLNRNVAGNATAGNTTILTLTGSNAGVNSFNGAILGDGSNGGKLGITVNGSTTWEIGKANGLMTYSGPVTINSGTLRAVSGSGWQSFGGGAVVTLANTATATLNLNGVVNQVIGSLAGGGSSGGTVALGAQSLATGVNNANASFAGSIQGTGGFTKVGTGDQILSGTNSYTGQTQVNGGMLTLDFSAASTVSNIISASSLLLMGGGTLQVTGKASTANSQTFNGYQVGSGASAMALSANPTANPLVLNLGAAARTSAGGTVDFTLPSGTQSANNGFFVFPGSNNGVNNGVLAISGYNHAFATVNGNTWATLTVSNVTGLATYDNGIANYTSTKNIDVASGDSVSGVTVNTLRFNGNNALTLSGTNRLNAGGILITSSATTGASISGGALSGRYNNFGDLVVINNGAQFTIGSTIIDAAGGATALTLSGSGTTILNGLNAYTGNTYINSGTVKAGSIQALGVSGTLTISDKASAMFELNGNSLTIAGLAGGGGQGANGQASVGTSGGTVALGSSTLTLGSSSDSTFGGTITGVGGSLVKVGTGKQTLRGVNTFTGGVTIKAGTVTAAGVDGNTAALGTGTVTLGDSAGGANDARLTIGNTSAAGQSYTLGNAIVLAPTTTGTLSVGTDNANNTVVMTGGVTGTNNFFINQINSSVISFTTNPINNNGNVTINLSGNPSAMNALIGSNVNNVAINNNNTTQAVSMNQAISNSGLITNAGTGSGTVTISGTIGGTTGVRQNSTTSGLALNAANTFTGDTLVQSGTLLLGNNRSIQNSAFDTSGAGVLDATSRTTPTFGGLKGSTSLSTANITGYGAITALTLNPQAGKSYTYSGAITNGAANMTLTKSGPGTQELSGNNTYSGATTVSNGALRLASANALPGGIGLSGGSNVVKFAGGVLELTATSGDFTRSLGTGTTNAQFTGGGGFSAYGSDRLVNLGGASTQVTWNAGNFVSAGSSLLFGSGTADARIEFQNPINLGAGTRTIQVDDNPATANDYALLSGVVTNGALVKTGAGMLMLGASTNRFSGLTVSNGTLVVSGVTTSSVLTVVSNATVLINGNYADPVTVESGATIGGTGTLSSLTLNSGAKLRVTIQSAGGATDALSNTVSLAVAGVTLEVVNTNLLTVGTAYTVLNGAHTGTFVGSNLPADWMIDYQPTAIKVKTSRLLGMLIKVQ